VYTTFKNRVGEKERLTKSSGQSAFDGYLNLSIDGSVRNTFEKYMLENR
jgi:hypothetical protein